MKTTPIRLNGVREQIVDAHRNLVCVHCDKLVVDQSGQLRTDLFYSKAGRVEYWISGLCEVCFDKITGENS
jgi:hypothetical protein